MAAKTIRVPAISCMHCVRTITRELSALPGVENVEADLARKEVTVTYEGEDTVERVRTTLREIGYPPAE